jgi:mono/diheme cytochrome c family protein
MRIFFVLFSIFFLYISCGNKSVKPVFPQDMSDKRKAEYTIRFNDGLDLYKSNCSACHGLFHKGKLNVPNFSKQQLDAYNAKLNMNDTTNHAVAKKLSENELNNVLLFLHYLRKDNDTK